MEFWSFVAAETLPRPGTVEIENRWVGISLAKDSGLILSARAGKQHGVVRLGVAKSARSWLSAPRAKPLVVSDTDGVGVAMNEF